MESQPSRQACEQPFSIVVDQQCQIVRTAGELFDSELGWPEKSVIAGMTLAQLHNKHHIALGSLLYEVDSIIRDESESYSSQFIYRDHNQYQVFQLHVLRDNESHNCARINYERLSVESLSREQLIRKTNLNENLFQFLPTGIIFQDYTGRIRLANPAAEMVLGMPEHELQRVTRESLPWVLKDTHDLDVEFDDHPGNKAIRLRQPQHNIIVQVCQIEHKTRRWLKVNAEPIFDQQTNKLQGVISSFTDINEQQINKIALQTLSDRSRVAIESADLGVWDWIPGESVMLWDSKMFSLFGFEDDPTVGPSEAFTKALHPEDKHKVKMAIHLLLKGEQNSKVDYRVIWPDGSIRYLRSQARITKGKNRRVSHVVGVTQDISKEVEAEANLIELAYYDDLTGAFNRGAIRTKLGELLQTKDGQVGIVMLGIDRFKDINDHYGHLVGDELLIELVNRLNRIARKNMLLARLGGDEFALVVKQIQSPDAIQSISELVIKTVKTPFFLSKGLVISITASIGISCFPEDGADTTDLFRAADLAMNRAKRTESETVVRFEKSMLEEVNKRYSLQSKMIAAVANEEFSLYYQPIIDLENRHLIGCEALLRWTDADGKFIPPFEFIPVIEEAGLIHTLGKWICRTAIKQFILWRRIGSQLEYVSVNVSPLQLKLPSFAPDLLALIDEYGIHPSNIQLEITEGTFLQESMYGDGGLNRLAEQGVRLAIDDFGTGYSSLAYLKRFNVDVIKVDRSFIIDIETDQSDKDIVSAILAMNKKLGFKTLIEGIETENQAAIVADLGSDSAQGYLFGRPTFADDFAERYIANYANSKRAQN